MVDSNTTTTSMQFKPTLTEGQTTGLLWGNGINQGASTLAGFGKDMMNYSMMNNMIDMQTKQMTAYYGLQGDLLSLQGHIADNNFNLQSKGMDTAVKIAELQKDRDVMVAKYRADASVKINHDQVLAATFVQQNPVPQNQYYGQAQYPLH